MGAAAEVADAGAPGQRTMDSDATFEWGSAVLAATATRDGSVTNASQSTDAIWDGQVVTVAGTIHGDVMREGSGEPDWLIAQTVITFEFTSPDPFVLHVEWEKTDYPVVWHVVVDDSYLGDGLCSVDAGDPQGSESVVCSGSGFYTLRAQHVVSRYWSGPASTASTRPSASPWPRRDGSVPGRDLVGGEVAVPLAT